ncbi:MAG: hypothetical protein O7E54_06890 [Planctomycetota bacterium]|nr:hypothetical protein [Planctomycetota bacterium]
MHSSVLHNARYVKFAEKNTVEVITMEETDRAIREKSRIIRTYKGKDIHGEDVDYLVELPGMTLEDVRTISSGNSPALDYIQGNKIPYHAIVDPHTLREMEGFYGKKSAQQIIEIVGRHVRALKKQYGPGVPRKLWRQLVRLEAEIDNLLVKEDIAGAMKAYRTAARLFKQPPELIGERLESAYEVIADDAQVVAARLDEEGKKADAAKIRKLVAK